MDAEPLHSFDKPKSKQYIEIVADLAMDPDGWFLKVKYIEKKTNKIASSHCIILKDLDQWKNKLMREGWIIQSK